LGYFNENTDENGSFVKPITPAAKKSRRNKKIPITKDGSDKEVKVLLKTPHRNKNPGIRRSSRRRIAPLEYWRNEHVVYGRRESCQFPTYIGYVKRVPVKATSPSPSPSNTEINKSLFSPSNDDDDNNNRRSSIFSSTLQSPQV